MDDLAQHTRKRKQDQDDVQDSLNDQSIVATNDPSSSSLANADVPRRQCVPELPELTEKPLWTTPATPNSPAPQLQPEIAPPPVVSRSPGGILIRVPSLPPKRLRIETRPSSGARQPVPVQYPGPIPESGSDIEDFGVVGPGSPLGSRLVAPPRYPRTIHRMVNVPTSQSLLSMDPITGVQLVKTPHIPPTHPAINRLTLRELELDIILRNPIIRHDLLFEPALLLRSRPKRDIFDKYWAAVWKEAQTGCTCETVDQEGRECATVCLCVRFPGPLIRIQSYPVTVPDGSTRQTLRIPSRLPALLSEFLEVMVFVIQPLNNTAVYTNPVAIRAQAQQHSAHAAFLRSVFDPKLIEHQLRNHAFDPAALFVRIGQTLKQHCAPMRDSAVEDVINQSRKPGDEGLKAFRMGLELLELMKLDIANHQLAQLRPWLIRNTGLFETKAFKLKFGHDISLHLTRRWLYNAHTSMSEPRYGAVVHPALSRPLEYQSMSQNHKIYMCVLRGLAELVFDKDFFKAGALNVMPVTNAGTVAITPISETPITPAVIVPSTTAMFTIQRATRTYICTTPRSTTIRQLSLVPETLYLDKNRLSAIATDAVDATVMYMFILLFRQLVLHNNGSIKIEDSDIELLRKEIRAIGPLSLATIFVGPMDEVEWKSEEEYRKRKTMKQDLVLHVVSHACRLRAQRPSSMPTSADVPTRNPPSLSLNIDTSILAVAERWACDNIRPGSPLSLALHNRIREVVFLELVAVAWPMANPVPPVNNPATSFMSIVPPKDSPFIFGAPSTPAPVPLSAHVSAAGLGPLNTEIKRLCEKLARVSIFHLNAHLPMYESAGVFAP